jgi:thioesterase domain-containing protein/acyl carrier protein
VAYVTPAIGSASVEEVRQFLRQHLSGHEVPSAVVGLDALPLNVNGKLDLAALPEPAGTPRDEAERHEPADVLERRLLRIWCEVLAVTSISVHDDFFDLGGHSLLAVDLFSTIERELGLRLPLSTIFDAPTVHNLAAVCRSNGWDTPWRSLARLTTTGSRPPLFFVTAGDGNSVGFGALARRLGNDQPFYALQPRGLDGRRLLEVGVESMARHYLQEIRQVQATGPYILGGRCFGTLVAYEMTRLLEAKGECVSALLVLDSVGPLWADRVMANGVLFDEVMNLARWYEPEAEAVRGDIFASAAAAQTFVEWISEPVEVLGDLAVNRYVYAAYRARPDLQAAYPLAGDGHAGLLYWTWVGGRSEMGMNPCFIPEPSPEARRASPVHRARSRAVDWVDVMSRGRVAALAERRQSRLLELASAMVLKYRAGSCSAPVVLIRSEELRNDSQLARWYGLDSGGIVEYYVDGSHLSMLREPGVASLARRVEACVDRIVADGCESQT